MRLVHRGSQETHFSPKNLNQTLCVFPIREQSSLNKCRCCFDCNCSHKKGRLTQCFLLLVVNNACCSTFILSFLAKFSAKYFSSVANDGENYLLTKINMLRWYGATTNLRAISAVKFLTAPSRRTDDEITSLQIAQALLFYLHTSLGGQKEYEKKLQCFNSQ